MCEQRIEDPYLTGSAALPHGESSGTSGRFTARMPATEYDRMPTRCECLSKQGRCNGNLSMVPIGNDGRMDAGVARAGAPALATSC